MNNLFREIGISFGVLIITIAAFAAGFLTQKYLFQKSTNSPLSLSNITGIEADSLFSGQTATFKGRVTAINGNTLSVENNQGTTGNLPLSNKFIVNKALPLPQGGMATPSSELKAIELNREVDLQLVMTDGKYQVVTLQFNTPPNR